MSIEKEVEKETVSPKPDPEMCFNAPFIEEEGAGRIKGISIRH